jgi:hypothetical protein
MINQLFSCYYDLLPSSVDTRPDVPGDYIADYFRRPLPNQYLGEQNRN